jgi:alpha 1,2-mannosyltransferase
METIRKTTRSKVEFGSTEPGTWEYPQWINQSTADSCRKNLKDEGIIYGGNLAYRHMCRWCVLYF